MRYKFYSEVMHSMAIYEQMEMERLWNSCTLSTKTSKVFNMWEWKTKHGVKYAACFVLKPGTRAMLTENQVVCGVSHASRSTLSKELSVVATGQ